MSQMRRILLVTVLVLVSLPAATAGAAAVHHSSKVILEYGGSGAFDGQVKSKAERCEKARPVDLLYDGGAVPRVARAFSVVGSDTTDQSGEFSIVVSVEGGDYKAKANRVTYTKNGHRHVCDAATSDKIGIH